ncbi:unnamed protein product, partial [Trichogramma brassicae]
MDPNILSGKDLELLRGHVLGMRRLSPPPPVTRGVHNFELPAIPSIPAYRQDRPRFPAIPSISSIPRDPPRSPSISSFPAALRDACAMPAGPDGFLLCNLVHLEFGNPLATRGHRVYAPRNRRRSRGGSRGSRRIVGKVAEIEGIAGRAKI